MVDFMGDSDELWEMARVNGGERAERGWSGCLKEWESGSVEGDMEDGEGMVVLERMGDEPGEVRKSVFFFCFMKGAELGCWMMGGAGGGRPAVM
ncbi:hypothetical protein GOBAR_AA14152 [Gossypium barbadense]|uniref:Uncharacterized protein n=1 Tax=Gossypium barbadense TaxID=3634 RepID=A0A2P5XT84_GOSBA|nr:hypothetical protein GOBAR_AA14152 [Gossypium barbadense]